MKSRTPAEQQMEELRRMRLTASKPRAVAPKINRSSADASDPKLVNAPSIPSPFAGGFELSEPLAKKQKLGPSLPLSPEIYSQIVKRQRAERSFKRRKDMGDWAAELMLALPFEAHRLSPEARQELFSRMQAWARARGLQ